MSNCAAVIPLTPPLQRSRSLTLPADLADRLWTADHVASSGAAVLATGWPALDAELPGGGWPAAGLIEILVPALGQGETQLLAPLCGGTRHKRHARRVFVSAAPSAASAFEPYAPGVAQTLAVAAGGATAPGFGKAPGRPVADPLAGLVWLTPATDADAAWAIEILLRSGAADAVVWWCERPTTVMLRRLHLSAQEGGTPLWVCRPDPTGAVAGQSSPAPLRVQCHAGTDRRLTVQVLKRRGPPMAAPLSLGGSALAEPGAALISPTTLPARDHAVARPAPERAAA